MEGAEAPSLPKLSSRRDLRPVIVAAVALLLVAGTAFAASPSISPADGLRPSGLLGTGSRGARIQTSCAVVAAPTLDLAFAR